MPGQENHNILPQPEKPFEDWNLTLSCLRAPRRQGGLQVQKSRSSMAWRKEREKWNGMCVQYVVMSMILKRGTRITG